MTFEKGQTQNRGEHLSAEIKTKIIKDRKAGKKWREIAADLKIPTKRAMTYAKRKWFKAGMKAEPEEKIEEKVDNPLVEVKEKKKDNPIEEKKEDKGVVDKTKKKAAANIDKAVEKQIKKSDKAPNKGKQAGDLNKDTGGVDKDAKTGLSERKSINIWFLVAIILVVATIGIIFLVLKPKGTEKADYNKPVKEKSKGFEDRSIEDL